MQPHCETGIYRTIIKVPMPIRIQPIKDFGVNFSCRNTKASTKVIKTLNLSTGTTFDVVSGNFADPAKAKGAETLADKFEHIVSDEYVDLSVEDEPQNAKTARSTAGKER